MTTTVKIEAHCSSDKEVIICIKEKKGHFSNYKFEIIQDGNTFSDTVYNNKSIEVYEVSK